LNVPAPATPFAAQTWYFWGLRLHLVATVHGLPVEGKS
jgi:hypothetical protein